eukprot:5741375-Alexandrium_andersonii.AAC.1
MARAACRQVSSGRRGPWRSCRPKLIQGLHTAGGVVGGGVREATESRLNISERLKHTQKNNC